MTPRRALLLFVDGVGIGEDDPGINPFAAARLPFLRRLLGGVAPVRDAVGAGLETEAATLVAADATLGVAGLPQSGTGQTSLLTGVNAAGRLGRHFGPWVPTAVRELLAGGSLLALAARAGRTVAFANAHPPGYMDEGGAGWRRPAAPPLAAHAAGALTLGPDALRAGLAVASGIVNDGWRRHFGPAFPAVTPGEAGANLARVCAGADVTLFAHYDTDHAGHRGGAPGAHAALERLDAFLAGLVPALPPDALLVLASDHGNLEDLRGGHTRNPVPVLAVGPGRAEIARRVRDITHVAPAMLALIGIDPP